MKYIIDIQEVEVKKILLLTGLSIWAVLGMACGEKAEDTSAKNSDSNQELAQQHQASSEKPSTKNPDPDMDGICSPWVSQKDYQDHFEDLCKGTDECPEESEDYDGYWDGDGCPDPDNDSDGVCDPWVSQNGVMDEYRSLCDGIDKCPDQAGSVDANGCP